MTSSHNELGIIVYAPAIVGTDGRPLTIIHGMERALPGLRLGWTTSEKEGARVFWGHATPFNAGLEIAQQTNPTVEGPPHPPRELPALKLPDEIRSPEIPHYLGWLNYWSAVASRAIGFPDPARDAELLSRARCTATGGWVVQLTDAPLDLGNPTHLDALKRAYDRFPEIGGRATA